MFKLDIKTAVLN